MTATTATRPRPPFAAGGTRADGGGASPGGTGPGQTRRHRFRPFTSTAANDAIATIALTALTMAGVFSMNRLFSGRSFVGPVLIVAVGAHATAWFCRRRGWPPIVATAVALVALVLLVSWSVLPGSTTYGLPWLRTLHRAGHAIHQATVAFHQVSAPAPVNQGFVLFAAGGVGVLAILADWAAFRMRATLEATVPSFALFIFCAAIGSRGSRTSSLIVEVSGLLAFVMIHQAMVDQETSAWFANRTDGALKSALAGGSVIGLAALIVALNLGFRLPGANRQGLVSWRASDGAGSGTRSAESPLVDLRGRLLDPSTTPVFTVASDQAEYWRQTALDTFDGTDWNALGTYHSAGGHLSEGPTPTVGGQQVVQSFSVNNLNSPWLPAAYRPVGITGIKGITYDPQSGSLLSNNNTLSGQTYQVTSVVSAGTSEVARLESAAPAAAAAVAPYLQLPAIDPAVAGLAQQIVAGKTTEYDKALALQNYLRDPSLFTYSLAYNYQGPDPLAHFLLVARTGYCQQFAGSFAVLARLVGIPTRLAVGWTWGTETSAGVYQVTDSQAHTWPEVYFTGVGWVPFEPTPGRGVPGAQNYTGVAPAEVGQSATNPGDATTTVPGPAGAAGGARDVPSTTIPKPSVVATHRHHGNGWIHALVWLAGLLGGLALLLGAVVALRWLHGVAKRDRVVDQAADVESDGTNAPQDRFARFRRDWSSDGRSPVSVVVRRLKAIVCLGWLIPILPWRARPAPPRPEVVIRAELMLSWSEVLELLAWSGVRRRPAETYRELAHRAAIELRGPLSVEPAAVHSLLQLADAATKAEFGLGSMTPGEAEAGATDLATVKRALLGSATNVQRLLLAVDPRYSVKAR